jgi:hypothetical protein
MNDKITNLEAKLRDMEATASEHAQNQTIARPDEPEANKDSEKAKTKKLSEGDFGHGWTKLWTRGGLRP